MLRRTRNEPGQGAGGADVRAGLGGAREGLRERRVERHLYIHLEAASDEREPDSLSGGDLNADGYSDVLIGATDASSSGTGNAYVFLGPLIGRYAQTAAEADIAGPMSGSNFGSNATIPGDVDGDGTNDMLVTAPNDDRWGSCSGASYLIPGPVSGSHDVDDVYSASFHGPGSNANLHHGTGVGDVNGDGMIDLVVGALYTEGDAPTSGAAFLLLGNGA